MSDVKEKQVVVSETLTEAEEKNGYALVKTEGTLRDGEKKPIGVRVATLKIKFGDTLDELVVQQGGGDQGRNRVFDAALAGLTIDFQNYVRKCLVAGRKDLVEGAANSWKFGSKPAIGSAIEQSIKMLDTASTDVAKLIAAQALLKLGHDETTVCRMLGITELPRMGSDESSENN